MHIEESEDGWFREMVGFREMVSAKGVITMVLLDESTQSVELKKLHYWYYSSFFFGISWYYLVLLSIITT